MHSAPKSRKSPVNLVVGRCLQARRKARGFTDLWPLASALGVTSNHIRLIETGWAPCPVSASYVLASQMDWNFPAVAELLVCVGHADAREKGTRDIEPSAVRDRLEELSRAPSPLQPLWVWCRDQVPDPELDSQPLADVAESPDFAEHVESLGRYLTTSFDPNIPRTGAPQSLTFGGDRLPLYFRSILDRVEGTMAFLESRLRNAVPLMNGEDGFNLLHQDFKKEIRSCEGFLSYVPDVSDWAASRLDFGFLWNAHAPRDRAVARINLFVLDHPDLKRTQDSLNKILDKRTPEGRNRKEEKRSYVALTPRRDIPLRRFAYSFATREARLIVGGAEDLLRREQDEIVLNNAWFFNMGGGKLFCTLDNYRGASATLYPSSPNFYSISLESENARRIRMELNELAP
jgi:hypothetical protein